MVKIYAVPCLKNLSIHIEKCNVVNITNTIPEIMWLVIRIFVSLIKLDCLLLWIICCEWKEKQNWEQWESFVQLKVVQVAEN